MRRELILTLLLVVLPITASAQDPADAWERLLQLRVGQKIFVVDKDLKKVKAQFLDISDSSLSFRASGKQIALERSDIVMVSRPPAKRRNVLLGMLIGGLMGASTWSEFNRAARHCDIYGYFCAKEQGLPGYSFPIFVGAAAGTGALIGSLLKRSEEILYVHAREKPAVTEPEPTSLEPGDSGKPEGGYVFAPRDRTGEEQTPKSDGGRVGEGSNVERPN